MGMLSKKGPCFRREYWQSQAGPAEYNARKLADLSQISLRQLERYFRADFGRPPQEWLSQKRIERACEMLQEAESIKEVAYKVGFKQPSHFCREFKRWFGTTPSEFCSLDVNHRSFIDSRAGDANAD